MADPIQKGVNSSSPASPGLSGAISDAIGAVANYVAPRSIVNRKKNIDSASDGQHSADTLGRQRSGQSSDSDNNY